MEKKVLIQKKKHLYKKIRILYNYIIENSGKKKYLYKKIRILYNYIIENNGKKSTYIIICT